MHRGVKVRALYSALLSLFSGEFWCSALAILPFHVAFFLKKTKINIKIVRRGIVCGVLYEYWLF